MQQLSRSELAPRLAAVVLALVSVYAWEIVASYIFCRGIGHTDLFVFPWLQWVQAALVFPNMLWFPGLRALNRWPMGWFILSTLIPLLGAVACIAVGRLLRRWRRPGRFAAVHTPQPLHGMTSPPTANDLARGNFSIRPRIFPSPPTRS